MHRIGNPRTTTPPGTDRDVFARLPQIFRRPLEPRPWYRRAARAIIVTVSILVAALLLGLAGGIITSLF